MIRFFVSSADLQSDTIVLTGDNASHAKVLRLKEGEQVLVCDGEANEVLGVISNTENYVYTVSVLERRHSATEPAVCVSIYVGFPKADKLEHVIQKATELGAHEIVAFPSARCVSKPDEKSLTKKLERWQKIAASAAEQSGRGRIPAVITMKNYEAALDRAIKADLPIVLYENEHANTLKNALQKDRYSSVSLISGPEGGFEEKEIALAMEKGVQVCTLGSRILRCETAPLCALSAVMYDAGEF